MKHLTPFIFGRHVHTTPNPIFLRFFPFSPECSFFARRTFLISLSNIYWRHLPLRRVHIHAPRMNR